MPEITIMGAGVFGLSIAYLAARRGAKIVVIERDQIGAGSSGGLVGALAPHTPVNWDAKKQFQLESLLMAEDFWGGVEDASNMATGYGRIGRLQPINDERALKLATERAELAEEHWGDAAKWEVVPVTIRGEWTPPSATGFLVHDTLSARMHPRLASLALAKAIENLGGEFRFGEGTPPNDAKTVIWATGAAGLEALSQEFSVSAGSGEKGQAALLGLSVEGQPQLYSNGLHVIPHVNGTTAIGSTSERYFEDASTPDALLDDLITRARAEFPFLANAPVIERWAGVRPRSTTRAPMLGAYPQRQGHFIVNGGFKIGFGMAPKIAQVMCDLVLDERDEIPEAFRAENSLVSA